MVERHAVRDAPAAVVAGHGEAVEPEHGHRLDLVGGHRPLAVRHVVRCRGRTERCAVAGEVGRDDREVLREQGRDRVPHDV